MSFVSSLAASKQIDYTSVDAASLKTLLLSRIPQVTAEWTDTSESDLGIVLVDLFCTVGDMLKAYQDRTMNEGFIDTATTLDAMQALCQLLGYNMTQVAAASLQLVFIGSLNPISRQSIRVPQGTKSNIQAADGTFIYFETAADIIISLPINTTSASNSTSNIFFDVVDPNNLAGGITPGTSIYIGGANNVNAKVSTVGGNRVTLTAALLYNPQAGDQISSVAGNYASDLVLAYEGQTHYQESLGYADGQPGLNFVLQYPNVLDDNANGGQALATDPNVIVLFVNIGRNSTVWTEVEDFSQSGPNDAVYATQVLPNGQTQILFNDGKNGAIPPYAAHIVATYRTGGGSRGIIPAKSQLAMTSSITGIVAVFNYTAGQGGVDPETVDHARAAAPASLATLNRAISLQDAASLIANADPSIIQVECVAIDWNTILAYILTNYMTPTSPSISGSTITNITNYMTNRLMATSGLTLQAVTLVPVFISINVYVLSGYSAASVALAVQEYLLSYFSLGEVGVGQAIDQSNVTEGLNSSNNSGNVQGIDHFDLTVFGLTGSSSPADINITAGSVAILPLANISITTFGGS